MEQHPVPQNVTTFQFRLIGDMTLKQFGYLCAGAILAFISYKLPLPLVFTWPLTTFFALLGVGFAFVPIEERPMDVWVFSFFKSIYSPTQYIWQREPPRPPSPSPITAPSLKEGKGTLPPPTPALATISTQAPPPAAGHRLPSPTEERVAHLYAPPPPAAYPPAALKATTRHVDIGSALFDAFLAFFRHKPKTASLPRSATVGPTPPSVTGKRPPPEKTPPPQPALKTTKESQERIAQLEATLQQLERQLAEKTAGEARITELQKQLTEVLSEKETIQKELVSLRRKIEAAGGTQRAQSQPDLQATVRVITTPDVAIKAGLPRLTNLPNVVTGIIKDAEGNLLPGILVTILDREGVPLRALKTNKLGQFAASTPLPNNTYVVEVEDPRSRFVFTRVQITLNGNVVPALEIIAKSQKQVSRERLAQQIFGETPA